MFLKIIFLNTWDCKIKDGVLNFLKENSSDTDIFCLQEAYEKTKWLCREILHDYELASDYKYVDDIDNFSLATYVKNGVEVISKKPLLMDTPDTDLALHIQAKYKNKLINICNVHGISQPFNKLDSDTRITQSQEIINFYKNLDGLKIIGGDFNLELNTKSVQIFEENKYTNLIKKYNIFTTRNKLAWNKFPEHKMYFSDYVFTNQDVVLQDFKVPEVEISDHLPMILWAKL